MTDLLALRARVLARIRRSSRHRQAARDVVQELGALASWVDLVPPPELLVTVVTATKDRPELLDQAIRSVVSSRSLRTWQHVVVDDGDGQAARVVADGIGDERVEVFENPGSGLVDARNLGLEQARGDVIVYLDDDNVMHPLWLASVAHAFGTDPDLRWGYGARLVGDRSAMTPPRPPGGLPLVLFPPFDVDRLRWANYIDANVIAHRSGATGSGFDRMTSNHSDWDLALRLASCSAPLRIPAIACAYRTAEASRMSLRPDAEGDLPYVRSKHAR